MKQRHLPDMDALEAAFDAPLPGAVREHLERCAACAESVAALRQTRDWALEAQATEPGDLFWRTLRTRIGARVEAEAGARRTVPQSPWLWSLAAAASVAAVLIAWPMLPRVGWQPAPMLATWQPLAAPEEDAGFALVADVVPAADDETEIGSECGTCLAGLSDDESLAMMEALRQELGRKS